MLYNKHFEDFAARLPKGAGSAFNVRMILIVINSNSDDPQLKCLLYKRTHSKKYVRIILTDSIFLVTIFTAHRPPPLPPPFQIAPIDI